MILDGLDSFIPFEVSRIYVFPSIPFLYHPLILSHFFSFPKGSRGLFMNENDWSFLKTAMPEIRQKVEANETADFGKKQKQK